MAGNERVKKPLSRPMEDYGFSERSPASIARARQKQAWLDQEAAAEAAKPERKVKPPPMRRIRRHSLPNAGRADLY